jgi:hypothetical protein
MYTVEWKYILYNGDIDGITYYSRPCKHISFPSIAENYYILNICVTKCQYICTESHVHGD